MAQAMLPRTDVRVYGLTDPRMTYGEFRRRLKAEVSCRSKAAGQASPHRMRSISRRLDGTEYCKAVLFEDDEHLPPHAIRSICSYT